MTGGKDLERSAIQEFKMFHDLWFDGFCLKESC